MVSYLPMVSPCSETHSYQVFKQGTILIKWESYLCVPVNKIVIPQSKRRN